MTMISTPSQNALQTAIVAVLRGDTALTALLGGANPAKVVGPRAPEGLAEPYVLVGDHLSIPDNTHTSFGRDITITLHVWTRARSVGPGQTISNRVNELLDHQVAALNAHMVGHRVVAIRQTFDQALQDPDPELLHHVLRFRCETTQTS
jgi:hypothetical protein